MTMRFLHAASLHHISSVPRPSPAQQQSIQQHFFSLSLFCTTILLPFDPSSIHSLLWCYSIQQLYQYQEPKSSEQSSDSISTISFRVFISFFATILAMTKDIVARLLPRAVTFSEYSDLSFIPSHHEKSTLWYSSKDMQNFRQSAIYDARKVSNAIKDLPTGDVLTHEQLPKCLGIENFLCHANARCAHQSRRAQIAAVLSEQIMQKHRGICDIERLSSVSKIGSAASMEKARKFALGYAALVEENQL